MQTVLIVDDDATQRRLLEATVGRFGYTTLTAPGGRSAVDLLSGHGIEVSLVLLDMVMPDIDGIEVLDRIRPIHPDLPVIVLTAHGGIDHAVRAIRAGANDFLVKPVGPERLRVTIENALKLKSLSGELSRLTRRTANTLKFNDLVLASEPMRQVVRLAERAANSNIPILIEGESGVGKEIVARAIQGSSDRAGKPFVVVNCAAIPEHLAESILFGHERGAFTGANERHIGKFQEADGGTLFLDEIGELRPDMQVKLLRALQEGEIDAVGARAPIKVDIRLISATNRDLMQMVREGRFREDLYYRLHVFPIVIPPLRDRLDDVEPLIHHFVDATAAAERKLIKGIDPDALAMLKSYAWPGNVRQLENTIFRAVVLAEGEDLRLEDFPQVTQAIGHAARNGAANGADAAGAPSSGRNIPAFESDGEVRSLEEVEGDMIRLAIARYDGRMSEVARRLRIGRSTLYRKLRALGLEVREPE